MSPMEQLAKQEYERGYSDGKSDYFAAGVAEGEMRARQRMIANRVVANQHPFAASGKPIDHIASTGKMIGCAYCDNPLFAGTKCNNCGRVTLAEPVKQEPVAWIEGYPKDFYAEEWFIAITIYGDRVVLKALPENYSHDFTTADGTYMKKENVKRWMQFPDSEFLPPTVAAPVRT